MDVGVDLPERDSDSNSSWKIARNKYGSRVTPMVSNNQVHDTPNHTNNNVIQWFQNEYPEAMARMKK